MTNLTSPSKGSLCSGDASEPLLSSQSATRAYVSQRSVHKKISMPQPLAHHLPEYVMWCTCLLTGLAMALINLGEVLAIETLVLWKFGTMQMMIEKVGLHLGMATLVVICMFFAVLGVSLIECFAKNCGGSGLPENKCYLSGSSLKGPLKDFFTMPTLLIRIATSILANAAGFPVGREGPSVVIGSNTAYLISNSIVKGRVRRLVRYTLGNTEDWVDVMDEERFLHATRIACAVGGACGIAMIFNSPIGGMLYMFEEMTSVSWPVELTFRSFAATTFCTLTSYALLWVFRKDINDFVIFAYESREDTWDWRDISYFVLLSAILGVVTSYHTRALLWMARTRKRLCSTAPCARITEVTLYGGFCAAIVVLVSLLGECHGGFEDMASTHVQFNCKPGEWNAVATLLVNTSHSAVKLLLACGTEGEFGVQSTALAFITYFVLNVGLSGLPVPGGAFTGTMLLGSLFGRCFGSLLRQMGDVQPWGPSLGDETYASSGIYALVGCAAMLCGFKQMTATVVIICVQCVSNINAAPVLMLAVSVSLAVNRFINKHGHDEQAIETKKLPFLPSEVPEHLVRVKAGELCDNPSGLRLQSRETADNLKIAFDTQASCFPVLDGESGNADRCVGIISLEYLGSLVKSEIRLRDSLNSAGTDSSSLGSEKITIAPFMDATPFTIEEKMPAARFFKMFAREGEKAARVVSDTGQFKGIISRQGLIDACYRE